MWEYSPQNCQNFEFWPEICTSGATGLQYFYEILSICTRLQVAFKFLVWSLSRDKHISYKHFPAVGAFSHKFSIAPSGETTDRIKKSLGVQKRDGPHLSPCQVRWRSWVARRLQTKKCDVFFCLLPAGLRVAQPCRYCFYSLALKWVFRPSGATRCRVKC